MAKNYTFAEACAIINDGTNMEAITDIGRRYPVLLHKVSKVTAIAGDKFVDLMSFMPDYLTANKVNTAMKGAAPEATETADENETEAEPTANAEATEADGAVWNESMSAKQLWDVLGKAGKRKLAKSTKKADLVEACKQAFGAAETETEDDGEAEAETAAETEANPYEGKSAMELFKECKKRGLKAAPKKPASYYVDLLVKADAEASNSNESDEDNWDDETEAAEQETKPAKKAAKAAKSEAKPTKKAAKAEDDGDDWDI